MLPKDAVNICFDLGKKCTAFAIMRGPKILRYGYKQFSKGKHDPKSDAELFTGVYSLVGSLVAWCEEQGYTPTRIAFEAAEQQKGRANEIYFSLMTALKVFGAKRNLPVCKVYSSTMKFEVAGHGHAKKAEMVEAINRRYGLSLSQDEKRSLDHNIADAISVGLVILSDDFEGTLREVA